MTAPIAHFAVNADDVDRARHFYGTVFGWSFTAWGPPGFFQVDTGSDDPGHPIGALQPRRDLLDVPTVGFECTVAVDDLDAVLVAVERAGSRILLPPSRIEGVGLLAFVADTEGNVVGAMAYDDGRVG